MNILRFKEFKKINESIINIEDGDMGVNEIDEEEFFELYISAHSGDLDIFREDFAEKFNSAAYIWMSDDKWEDLIKIFDLNDDRYEFITISGETMDGDNTGEVLSYLEKGWTIFDSDQNGDNYDSILYYHPNASRADNSIKKYSL